MTYLKADVGRIGGDSVLLELIKLSLIRQFDLPIQEFSELPVKWLQKYRRRTSTESSWELRRHPPEIRYSLIAALCWQRQHEIIDTLIDLLIQVIHKIGTRLENKVVEWSNNPGHELRM